MPKKRLTPIEPGSDVWFTVRLTPEIYNNVVKIATARDRALSAEVRCLLIEAMEAKHIQAILNK